MCVSNINLFYQYSIAVFPTYLFYHILNLPSIIQICRTFSKIQYKKYIFSHKKRADRNLPVKNSPKHYVGANSVRPPVVHYRNLFLFQRRFKPSHNNISRLNSVLLVKWRSVPKRIIQTKLLVLYLAHSVIRQNVKRFQRLEL